MTRPTLISEIIAAYCRGESCERIGLAFGISRYRVDQLIRMHAPNVIRPKGVAAMLAAQARAKLSPVAPSSSPRDPPPEVMAEAMRASRAPRTLTAEICGDPPRGRSALDQRRETQP